jgi:drug/metabolite transporter superfamily protein YnfA
MNPSAEIPSEPADAHPTVPQSRKRNPLRRFIAWFSCDYDPQLERPAIDDGRAMPSLDLGLDLMRDNLAQQMSQADALDTKAGFILGSASLITGVLVAWHKLPLGAPGIVQWLPAIAIAVYAAVVTCAAFAYFVREYSLSPGPVTIRDKFVFWELPESKDEIFHGMVLAWLRNSKQIGLKLHWLELAFIAFGVQITVVAAIIVTEIATISIGG